MLIYRIFGLCLRAKRVGGVIWQRVSLVTCLGLILHRIIQVSDDLLPCDEFNDESRAEASKSFLRW